MLFRSILGTMLQENGVTEWSPLFSEPHPSREFCVQYGETDYDFLCRMAAEEGIFFYEEHAYKSTDQSLVLCDTVRHLPESFISRDKSRRHTGKTKTQGSQLQHFQEYATPRASRGQACKVEERSQTKERLLHSTHLGGHKPENRLQIQESHANTIEQEDLK